MTRRHERGPTRTAGSRTFKPYCPSAPLSGSGYQRGTQPPRTGTTTRSRRRRTERDDRPGHLPHCRHLPAVQRCQVRRMRNVLDHLSPKHHVYAKRTMQEAYRASSAESARRKLTALAAWLQRKGEEGVGEAGVTGHSPLASTMPSAQGIVRENGFNRLSARAGQRLLEERVAARHDDLEFGLLGTTAARMGGLRAGRSELL